MKRWLLLVAMLLMAACAPIQMGGGMTDGEMGDMAEGEMDHSDMAMDDDSMDGMTMPEIVEGALTIANVRANMTLPSSTGSVWLFIMNGTDTDDMLLGGEIPGCGVVEIHNMFMENDVMIMRQVEDGLPIPAGEIVELKQGGLHIMCINKEGPLEAGTDIEFVLQFENAGAVNVSGTVVPPSGMVMAHGSDGEGDGEMSHDHDGEGDGHDTDGGHDHDDETKDDDGHGSHDHDADGDGESHDGHDHGSEGDADGEDHEGHDTDSQGHGADMYSCMESV
ncbi:MAG: copper chaperone PCu(A)C [Chloroflexota bacterium]